MVTTVFLGKYEVVRHLGEGSMGRVYLARERGADRSVVVKVMTEEAAAEPQFREFFEREAALLTRFRHPNVVALIDASADPAEPCIVMEYVHGTTLTELLRQVRRFTPDQVGKLLGPLCSALYAAHSAGIIHRDLKPDNLMVVAWGTEQQTLKIMDFGMATLAGAVYISLDKLQGDATASAAGTPEYMPPEHIRGDEADHRADIYSLGVILFEMLTGRLPFDLASVDELFDAHLNEEPPSCREAGANDVPPALEAVVRSCLSKYPAERPQSAWELAKLYGKAAGMQIMEPPDQAARPDLPGATPTAAPDTNAVIHEIDAYMPERLAVAKLRGFVQDVGGELVDSVPGVIQICLGGRGCRYQPPVAGALAWLGLGNKRRRQISLELRMAKTDRGHSAQLHITILLRPATGDSLPEDPRWHDCCAQIYTDLRGYLMAERG
jgi:serine/threonine-protein kinase